MIKTRFTKKSKKKVKSLGKVRNATPNIFDGIEFRSKLETYCYQQLKNNNIDARYESTRFEILPAFIYNDEHIRPMTYMPDFIGKGFIIECKGLVSDSFPLRYKLFKHFLYTENLNYKLYLPRNRKQVDEVIQQILNGE
jgi:CRISPR/Cas system CMR-associated protein Cmr3 (group 5 of RAMP superfamily)